MRTRDALGMYDFIIIGGGILGASTAYQLQQCKPTSRILLLEKEASPALHQTGHNSGVIHAGIYYPPGSLKSNFCLAGNKATKQFCQQHNIDFDECGKLLVATSEQELERMQMLERQAQQVNLTTEQLSATELHKKEPLLQGIGALFIPSTAIVDFQKNYSKND
ncbi:FAD-dependent oxidoreductase [Piscirickettsia litoralis]|uniref:FAD-dependent oxidoreductase n=1 Tax=Piscirickettsia litoralis TaxID=1891921 RepID=UPI0022862D17|nr:FAD-dependent oxidoreductase [Piscirickettsia litoralis]